MRPPAVLGVLLPPVFVLGAALGAAPARESAQDQLQQTPQKPVFRSGVNLVEVDAVVLDAMNRPVADLDQRDFQILEDGRPRDIVTFARVELPALPPREPTRSDVVTNEGAEQGRMILLVLDDPNSLAANTNAIKRAARRFVERLAPQDQVALLFVSLRSQGAREFTTDHAAIIEAIEAFGADQSRVERYVGPNSQGELPRESPPAPQRYSGLDAPRDPGAESAMIPGSIAFAGVNLKALFDADRPFRITEDVGRYLAPIQRRRKAIVYIGQGQTRQSMGGDIKLPVDRAIAAAASGNVTFYSIDPSGPPDPAHPDRPNVPQAVGDFARLAAATGGFANFHTSVDQAVDRVVHATSVYYLLGYYADPETPTRGRARRIEVRTPRPDLRILARRSYQPDAAPARTGAPNEALRAIRNLVPHVDLGLKAFAAPFRDATKPEQPIEVAVEVSAPEFAPGARPTTFADDVELVVVAIEPGEKVRATRHVTAHVALDGKRAAVLGAGRYLLRTRVDVPPGQYQLRLGARSAAAGRAGSVYYDVTVPDFRSRPLSLSGVAIGWATKRDPMAVASTDARPSLVPFEPVLAREFMPGDGAWAYARVYRGRDTGDGQALLTASVIHLDDGKPAWTSSEERPASEFGSRGETEYRVALPLDALQPGAYRLRIDAALDGRLVARRELDFSVKGGSKN